MARPVRMCDSCGGVDDHPRHVYVTSPGEIPTTPVIAAQSLANAGEDHREAVLAQIMDDTVIMKHMDCCRTDGCPDGSCDEVTKGAEDLKGPKLVKHLTKGGK